MALSGVHVAAGYVGSPTVNAQAPLLLGKVTASETMAAGGTSTARAPGASEQYGPAVFEVYGSADFYIAWGTAPNSTSGPRVFVPANTTRDVIANAGDYLKWELA